MAELNPPTWLQNGCHTAQGDRQLVSTLVCAEGVRSVVDDDLLVLDGASGLLVIVSAGNAVIQGDDVSGQGMYQVHNSANENITLAASDPTDARIDLIIARVYDSQYAGALDEWRLEAVTGTPSPSPSPPALPSNAIPLAQVTVGAGVTTLSAANILDVRQPIRLCSEEVFLSVARDTTTFNRTPGQDSVMNWDTEVEATGGAALILSSRLSLPAGVYSLDLQLTVDGPEGENWMMYVRKNAAGSIVGGELIGRARSLNPAGDGFLDRSLSFSKTIRMANDGDYLEAFVQLAGAAVNTLTSILGADTCFATLIRVSR